LVVRGTCRLKSSVQFRAMLNSFRLAGVSFSLSIRRC